MVNVSCAAAAAAAAVPPHFSAGRRGDTSVSLLFAAMQTAFKVILVWPHQEDAARMLRHLFREMTRTMVVFGYSVLVLFVFSVYPLSLVYIRILPLLLCLRPRHIFVSTKLPLLDVIEEEMDHFTPTRNL